MNQHLDRLDGLAPFLRTPVLTLLQRCQTKLGRTLMVVYGWRSVQEQALLYQKGRRMDRETGDWVVTDASLVVTHAKPGTTAHNVIMLTGARASCAVDLIPLNADGTAQWDVDMDFWDNLYEMAWRCGLDPLGDPIGSYLPADRGHFEEPAWALKLEGLALMQPLQTVSPSV